MHNLPWQQFETHVQTLLGLSSTKASGSLFHDPGDGIDHGHYSDNDFALIVDCKLTEKDSFRIKRIDLLNWKIRAAEMGKRFALPIRFFKPHRTDDFVVLSLDDFAELLYKVGET